MAPIRLPIITCASHPFGLSTTCGIPLTVACSQPSLTRASAADGEVAQCLKAQALKDVEGRHVGVAQTDLEVKVRGGAAARGVACECQ